MPRCFDVGVEGVKVINSYFVPKMKVPFLFFRVLVLYVLLYSDLC